ncbi:hypothetical protein [Paraburkholderia aspalathi]|uniref:hypothetical protein n=1 Tax=Paraburkholderia aspalathi TaxID=1324617 RepID=UPI0019095BA0|nr:hypothetical protein [Paraburkholderia aspalathi]MBK3842811.1 hypothetical protein [Paraburkholderia aspalathi]
MWFPVLLALTAAVAVAVLKLWPEGKSTQTAIFWFLLIGAPSAAVCPVFGWRLNRWEQEQLTAEESEREKMRVESLWRDWCRRSLPVAHAEAFLPQAVNGTKLADRDAQLPVNINRSAGFDWAKDKTGEQRRLDLLGLIAARFKNRLEGTHEVALTLILDRASFAHEASWKTEAKRIFEAVVPGVEVNVDASLATDCVDWIEQHIDSDELPARLIVAAQVWLGEGDHAFSEGAAAILFAPRTVGFERITASSAPVVGYVLRPMTTESETLKADLSQLVEMQVAPDSVTHAWFTGCDDAFEVATVGSISSPETKVVDRLVDSFAGLPGPVSGWIALSLALDAAKSIPDQQLVVWHQTGGDQPRLCVVAPGEFEGS